jgi:DNA-binding response OmpR family regulator
MSDAPIKVLLIEDIPADAAAVRLALAESEYVRFQVRVVSSLSEASRVIATDSFAVVLLGWSLSAGPAKQTLVQVRASNPGVLLWCSANGTIRNLVASW